MMAPSRAPGHPRRHHEILLAQRQQLAAHHAGQPGPTDQRQDHGDAEVHLHHRPVRRQRGGQRHPQRYGRDGAQKLDHPLHEHVGRAAEVARDAADGQPRHEAQGHADQSDRQRYAGAVEDAREHVAPQAVGSEQVDGALVDAEQVHPRRDEAPHAVLRALREQPDRVHRTLVGGEHPAPGDRILLQGQSIDERPMQPPLVEYPDALQRRVQCVGVAFQRRVGTQELTERPEQVEQAQDGEAHQRDAVLFQFPPRQLPLRGHVHPFRRALPLCGCRRGQRSGRGGAHDRMPPVGAAQGAISRPS